MGFLAPVAGVTAGMAAFATACAVLWRTGPARWLRRHIDEDRVAATRVGVTQALTDVLANGNPITAKLDDLASTVRALGDSVTVHVEADTSAFARIETRLAEFVEDRVTVASELAERSAVLGAHVLAVQELASQDREQLRRVEHTVEGIAADLAAAHERADSTDGDPGAAADAGLKSDPGGTS